MFSVFYSISDQYKPQEMYERCVSEDHFLIAYCPDKYETQGMYDEVVDDSLAAWKLVPDWFVTSKMITIFDTALCTDDTMYSTS